MDKNEISEEVTVTPVIRDLEKLFNRAVGFIWMLIKLLFKGLGDIVRLVLKNIWIVLIVSFLGGALGYFSTKFFPREYGSSMVLKLNVDSKEQLKNDINYLNALIDKKETKKLGDLLKISEAEAGSLSRCKLDPSATYVEKTEAVNQLYKSIDTALFELVDYEDLLAHGSSELSAKFKITITATDQEVFQKLEEPLLAYLESSPELNQLLEISRKSLLYQRAVYQKEIDRIDTLTKVMNEATLARARTSVNSGTSTNILFGSDQMEKQISALDLQDRSLFYSQKITKIDLEIQEHASCYFVNSHLNSFGAKIGYGGLLRAIISSVFVFLLTLLILLLGKWRKTIV